MDKCMADRLRPRPYLYLDGTLKPVSRFHDGTQGAILASLVRNSVRKFHGYLVDQSRAQQEARKQLRQRLLSGCVVPSGRYPSRPSQHCGACEGSRELATLSTTAACSGERSLLHQGAKDLAQQASLLRSDHDRQLYRPRD